MRWPRALAGWCAGQRVCAGSASASSQRLQAWGSLLAILRLRQVAERPPPPPAAEKPDPWPCGPAPSSAQDKRGAGSSRSLECWAARWGGDGERVPGLPVGFSAGLSPSPVRGTLPAALCAPHRGVELFLSSALVCLRCGECFINKCICIVPFLLDPTCKQYPIVLVFLWLADFTYCDNL